VDILKQIAQFDPLGEAIIGSSICDGIKAGIKKQCSITSEIFIEDSCVLVAFFRVDFF